MVKLHFAQLAGRLPCFLLIFSLFLNWVSIAQGALGPADVLILVNENSPTSRYIARLYRYYYPNVQDHQVLCLSGLVDCSGSDSTAGDEIITRQQFENLIAAPLRNYLIENNLVDSTKVIITTAGLPYRIEDTHNANIIYPGGGGAYIADNVYTVNAASVESELTVLFQIDSNSPTTLETDNRVVNPYQGYRRSSIDLFNRDILANRANFRWRAPRTIGGQIPPIMEGLYNYYGVRDRKFGPGDIYLTCRLDGPKNQGQSAIFAVRQILERSRRASRKEFGINPLRTIAIFDDAPNAENHNYNRIFNLDRGVDYIVFDPCTPQPPDTLVLEVRDDYWHGFEQATQEVSLLEGQLNVDYMNVAYNLMVMLDLRPSHRMNQADIYTDKVVAYTCFGLGGDEGNSSNYLLAGGPDGNALFNLTNGAVFASVESFNAVTMFSDVTTGFVAQGKIVDFLAIGGSGAIGHSFEPLADAIIDTEFLFYNLLADADGDSRADMTFVEAAFTALPYLSWSEVVVGDPLMRITYGRGGGGGAAWQQLSGDLNLDDQVNVLDLSQFNKTFTVSLEDTEKYHDLCDLNQDGFVNMDDYAMISKFW